MPSRAFFYGLALGEEISVDIEEGKTLFIKLINVSEPDRDGYQRTEMHGTRWMMGLGVLGVAAMWLLMVWH